MLTINFDENCNSGFAQVCFKAALTIIFDLNLNRRKIMRINKNKISKMQSILLTLILMVAALGVSSAADGCRDGQRPLHW